MKSVLKDSFGTYNTLEICKIMKGIFMAETKSRAIYLTKSVLISYLVTLFLLLITSFLMLQVGMSSGAISIAIVVIYVLSVFLGSFYMGRHVEQKRYLWGLIAALFYFVVYIIISLITKGDTPIVLFDYVKTLLIVACSGMLGGMLS